MPQPIRWLTAALLLALLALAAIYAQDGEQAARQERPRPGRQKDGSILLPNGWKITPAGKQVPLSTLPMSMALSPGEEYLLVLNAGYLPPSISVIDLETGRETGRVPVEDGWLGLAFNEAGDRVYVGGGSRASVFEFEFEQGDLARRREFPVVPSDQRNPTDHVGDVALSPDGRFLYAANLFRNSVAVLNTQTGFVVSEIKTGRRPYRLLPGIDGQTLLVSHWADSSVGLYSLSDGRLIERIPVGPHPTDLLLGPAGGDTLEGRPEFAARLFVACANTNSVWVFGVTEGNRFHFIERITVAPTPSAPFGSTPTALALSADERLLYVVCSDNNMIAVADVSQQRAALLAAIPTGWYPTDVKATGSGGLLYLSGKGLGSHPIPQGPDPTRRAKESQYVAALQTGSLGVLPPLNQADFAALTSRVIANTPYDDRLMANAGIPEGHPIPSRPGDPSPIQHVIYVLKENRAYDQVLGDIERGEGDPQLAVFGEAVTPNHHKLAREFVLFDHFYTNGDVSADGQNWSVAAMANDYIQKMWPSYYGRRRQVYDFEGSEPSAFPAAGYLWSNALAHGLSIRNYGMWTATGGDGSVRVNDPGLKPHTNLQYPGFDLSISDGQRVEEFLREFRQFEAEGNLPQLMFVRLPGDHTAGQAAGKPTAKAMMAEHDQALGELIEAVSHSRFWPQTAVFVVEDDGQDGADHIDSHRSVAFVISPYAKRGFVDSAHYSTASVLRTMELILGLRPMTQFDAAAPPLADAFTAEADLEPYKAAAPQAPTDEMNPAGAGAQPRRVEFRPPPPPPSGSWRRPRLPL